MDKLLFNLPSKNWSDALPLGNGRIGAMVENRLQEDIVSLNEDTLWSGFFRDEAGYEVQRHLGKVREKLFRREFSEAHALVQASMQGQNSETYQPLGSLKIAFPFDEQNASGFFRQLDLEKAIVSSETGNCSRRQCFVSAPDQVLVYSYSGNAGFGAEIEITLETKHPALCFKDGQDLVMQCSMPSRVVDNYLEDHPSPVFYETDLSLTGFARICILFPDNNIAEAPSMVTGTGGAIPSMVTGTGGAIPSMVTGTDGAIPPMVTGTGGAIPSMVTGTDGAIPQKVTGTDGAIPQKVTGTDTEIPSMVTGTNAENFSTGRGSVCFYENKIIIRGASHFVILLSCESTFAGKYSRAFLDKKSVLRKTALRLNKACRRFPDLLRRHQTEHKKLYAGCTLSSGVDKTRALDFMKREFEQNKSNLVSLYFNYGRYLMIAASRPGTQCMNLQGIWNDLVMPPWGSNYTTNINTQMNYWPAESCGLSACHEPLFDFIQDLSETGSRIARINYGCRGWAAHHNSDLWRKAGPVAGDPSWAFWPFAGAWLVHHLWQHYEYNPDLDFLTRKAWPLIRGAAEFLMDWMFLNKHGHLVSAPSTSPENCFLDQDGNKCAVTISSAMDLCIARDLWTICLSILEIFEQNKILAKEDEEIRNEIREKLASLPVPVTAVDGCLLEWGHEAVEAEPGHRHFSHLYGLYPADLFEEGSALHAAAVRSFEKRMAQGGGGTGWSLAWAGLLYSRLKDGNKAGEMLEKMLKDFTQDNLFNLCPPFQIDGNFGATALIAEMLLQNHKAFIELLPSLPDFFHSGSVKGLRAKNGISVNLVWKKGKLFKAEFRSDKNLSVLVKYKNRQTRIDLVKNKKLVLNDTLQIRENAL